MIVIDKNQHVRMNRDFCPIYDDLYCHKPHNAGADKNTLQPAKKSNEEHQQRYNEKSGRASHLVAQYYDYGDGVCGDCDVYDYNVDNDDYGDHVEC